MTSPLTLTSLPLFPLHTVLFPGGYLPLRVFEPRYRDMVRCCRAQGTPFGVVTLLTGEEVDTAQSPLATFHTVGTLAHIESVSAMRSGLELIHCLGQGRFHIQASRKLAHGLWVADVQLLPADREHPVPADLAHSVTALRQVLQQRPQQHLERATTAQFADCGWVANRWCELFTLDEQMQLQLLEVDSPLLRLELVTDALEQAGIVPPQQTQT